MVFLDIPISWAKSSIVTLLNPRFKNSSVALCKISSFINHRKCRTETLKTKKVSKVLQLFNIALPLLILLFLDNIVLIGGFPFLFPKIIIVSPIRKFLYIQLVFGLLPFLNLLWPLPDLGPTKSPNKSFAMTNRSIACQKVMAVNLKISGINQFHNHMKAYPNKRINIQIKIAIKSILTADLTNFQIWTSLVFLHNFQFSYFN